MAWDTILFDLDGTLTKSDPGIIHGVEYMVEQLGLEPKPKETYFKMIGPRFGWSLRHFFQLPEERIPEAIEAYRTYYNEKGYLENAPYPGVEELLDELRAAGKKLMVATSKAAPVAMKVLEHFDLLKRMDFVGGAFLEPDCTDKAGVIRRCLKEAAGSVVMVGDRQDDVFGAKENGIPTIGVLYGYGDREELSAAGAAWIAEDIPALRALLLTERTC